MFYNSLISAIPREWKKQIKSNKNGKFTRTNPLSIKLDDKITQLTPDIKCKQFYAEFIRIKTKDVHAAAIHKWEELYPNYQFEWKEIYSLPYKTCRETNLQSFQYQIINRYIACNSALFKWGKVESPLCTECKEIEDIEHLLFTCSKVKPFWSLFRDFWQQCYGFVIDIKVENILFGLSNEMNLPEIYALNFCILMAKRFIYVCNFEGNHIIFKHYLMRLKNRLITENLISIKKDNVRNFKSLYGPIEALFDRKRNHDNVNNPTM